jgi:uncharacterized OB-fold protein
MSHPLPPSHRTPLGFQLRDAQTRDQLVLQVCQQCETVQYPPRNVCVNCLDSDLNWQPVSAEGKVLASNQLHSSVEEYYQEGIPFELASVKLNAGPVVLACNSIDATAGDQVRVLGEQDEHGNLLLRALKP